MKLSFCKFHHSFSKFNVLLWIRFIFCQFIFLIQLKFSIFSSIKLFSFPIFLVFLGSFWAFPPPSPLFLLRRFDKSLSCQQWELICIQDHLIHLCIPSCVLNQSVYLLSNYFFCSEYVILLPLSFPYTAEFQFW